MNFFPPILLEVLFASDEQVRDSQVTGTPILVEDMERKTVDFYSIDAVHPAKDEKMTDVWNSAGRWLLPTTKDNVDMEIMNQLNETGGAMNT